MDMQKVHGPHGMTGGHYGRLALMALLSFLTMYGLMYAMVDRFANVFPNLNQAYMAALMTAPMVIIELLVMSSMYPNRKANLGIVAGSAVLLIASWSFIREQTGIAEDQFLRSMIPHHAGAILMCEEAKLHDPEIEKLCGDIRLSQQQEIDFMKAKLAQRRD
jgi:hypothetical protein